MRGGLIARSRRGKVGQGERDVILQSDIGGWEGVGGYGRSYPPVGYVDMVGGGVI